MRTTSRILRARWRSIAHSGAMWLTAAEMMNRGCRFVLFLLIARAVGAEDYGAWVVAAAAGTALANAGDLGLGTVLTARIAAEPDRARAYSAATFGMAPFLLILGLLAAGAMVPLAPDRGAMPLMFLVLTGGVLESTSLVLLTPLRAAGRNGAEAVVRSVQGASLLVAGGVLMASAASVSLVAAAFPAVGLASILIALSALVQAGAFVRPRLEPRLIRQLLSASMPVFAATLAFFVYFRIDAFLLAHLRGAETAGIYGAAYNVAFGLMFVPSMVGRVLLPRFASWHVLDVRAGYLRLMGAAALCSLLLAVTLAAATPVVLAVYGGGFEGIAGPYLLLIVAQGVYFMTHLHYMLLFGRGRSMQALACVGFSLLINVAANMLLIPRYGASGAASAAVISECVLLGCQLGIVRRLLTVRRMPEAPLLAAA